MDTIQTKDSSMSSLSMYLRHYRKQQEKILLCYRPTKDSSWADRCFYLSDDYDPRKPYNHRSILSNEVVIEFDLDNKAENRRLAEVVIDRLMEDKIPYAAWRSGNKSTHVHVLLEVGESKNVQLLKKCFVRYYTEGLPMPDMRLCVDNHLIRAEYGVHEKTGNRKTLISKHKLYPCTTTVPELVWKRYYHEFGRVVQRRLTMDTKDLTNLPGFNFILNSAEFRECEDGRERALFMLIHVLKPKFVNDKAGLTKYLQEWYRYSSSKQGLSDEEIRRKINYHWDKNYTFTEKYLNELLESIGKTAMTTETNPLKA